MKHFSITQTEYWARFQKEAGRSVHTVEFEAGAKAHFVEVPLFLGKKMWRGIGVNLEEASRGDMTRLVKTAKKHGVCAIRFEGYGIAPLDSSQALTDKIRAKFEGRTIAPVNHPYLPQFTIVLDLKKSEEELLKEMKRKGRYNIKLSEEKVDVRKFEGGSVSPDQVGDFFRLVSQTALRDGFAPHPREYYEKMLLSLGDKARLYMAYADERPVAGIITVYGEKEAVYYYGASSHADRALMAPYALQWTAIKDAKKAGKSFYDFMGVARPAHSSHFSEGLCKASEVEFDKKDPLCGVSDFKQKFGGELVAFGKPFDLVLLPAHYKLYKLMKFLRGLIRGR